MVTKTTGYGPYRLRQMNIAWQLASDAMKASADQYDSQTYIAAIKDVMLAAMEAVETAFPYPMAQGPATQINVRFGTQEPGRADELDSP